MARGPGLDPRDLRDVAGLRQRRRGGAGGGRAEDRRVAQGRGEVERASMVGMAVADEDRVHGSDAGEVGPGARVGAPPPGRGVGGGRRLRGGSRRDP